MTKNCPDLSRRIYSPDADLLGAVEDVLRDAHRFDPDESPDPGETWERLETQGLTPCAYENAEPLLFADPMPPHHGRIVRVSTLASGPLSVVVRCPSRLAARRLANSMLVVSSWASYAPTEPVRTPPGSAYFYTPYVPLQTTYFGFSPIEPPIPRSLVTGVGPVTLYGSPAANSTGPLTELLSVNDRPFRFEYGTPWVVQTRDTVGSTVPPSADAAMRIAASASTVLAAEGIVREMLARMGHPDVPILWTVQGREDMALQCEAVRYGEDLGAEKRKLWELPRYTKAAQALASLQADLLLRRTPDGILDDTAEYLGGSECARMFLDVLDLGVCVWDFHARGITLALPPLVDDIRELMLAYPA